MSDYQVNDNNTCVVCFKNVLYYSIGECDHPVCYECSTRMRVLCLQNECPICRQDLSRVVFTESIQPYKELRNRVFSDKLFERQFKIGFCSEEIKDAYERLLENRCKLCTSLPPFRSFGALSDHMRKVHERYYCDLCVKHLKIFTIERRCYTRQELGHHRRKGDVDDTSHRGHPLCEFCEERFMDADELYRHLRKEHLYCHLCDADGRNYYYATHTALAQHFRTDHYLCEEGECAGQHLTAVFRTEIDLKAHKALVHGRGLARAAARQARTLELQFNITPHAVAQRTSRDNANGSSGMPPPSPPPAPEQHIDTGSVEQFPRLSFAPAAPVLLATSAPARQYKGPGGLTRDDKNFPALDGSCSRTAPAVGAAPRAATAPTVAATLLRNTKPNVSIQLHSQPASASNFRLTQTSGNRISIPHQQKKAQLSDDDFPSLGMSKDDHPSIGAGTVQPPKVSMINSQEMQALKNNNNKSHSSKKPQLSTEAFPALSTTAAPTAPPQWITVSRSKDKAKPVKVEPPPQPKESTFNAVSDFPILPANNSKSKSKKNGQAPQIVAQNDNSSKTNSKKDKKKQNNNTKAENVDYSTVINTNSDKKAVKESNLNNNMEGTSVERKTLVLTESITPTNSQNYGNGDFAMTPSDYPPLNPKCEVVYKPNGTLPDSFSSKMTNGAPPGLKGRPSCDGMTFTNSAGQTFPAPLHAYIQPPDFVNRNRALVKKFTVALGSAEAVDDFKVASRAFRDNIITADEFYQHCEMALNGQLEEVFPELVALLPDIVKQQELVVGRRAMSQLRVCSVCGQLLAATDVIAHDTAHWPPLSAR